MRAALVVVNYASSRLLAANSALAAAPGLGVEVIVADNLSTAAERRRLRGLAAERGWELVEMAGNEGFGIGVNAAVARAQARGVDTVVLLNPDADMTGDTLLELAGAAHDRPGALIAPSVVLEDGSVWFEAGELNLRTGSSARRPGARLDEIENSWLTGACLAMSVDVWRAAGGFDDRYFMYWEDIEFSWAVRESGGALVSRPDLKVTHLVGGTQDGGGVGRSALYYRYNCRNRLLFAADRLPPAVVWRWLLNSPQYAYAVLRRGVPRRQLPRLGPAPFWACLRGTVEGAWVCAQRLASSSRSSRDHLRSPAASSAAANAKNAP